MFRFVRNLIKSYKVYFKDYSWGFAKIVAFAIVFHALYDFFKDMKEIFIYLYLLIFAGSTGLFFSTLNKNRDKRNK